MLDIQVERVPGSTITPQSSRTEEESEERMRGSRGQRRARATGFQGGGWMTLAGTMVRNPLEPDPLLPQIVPIRVLCAPPAPLLRPPLGAQTSLCLVLGFQEPLLPSPPWALLRPETRSGQNCSREQDGRQVAGLGSRAERAERERTVQQPAVAPGVWCRRYGGSRPSQVFG